MANVAFLGLGVMGYPMAGHLQSAGHSVTVYNRTTAKADAWVAEHGGSMATTPAEAAQGVDFVMACVGNDDDLRGVCLGDTGAFAGMSKGAIFCGSHNRFCKSNIRTICSIRRTGAELCGCADIWGPSGRRKWRAIHHVWW